jgi:formate-dependent nitrite reductase membrane component NrfD
MRERAMVPDAKASSYYGRPILKRPVWKWYIAGYLFSGGLAGGSSLLGFGARRQGDDGLAVRANRTALIALLASLGFLVADLGKPRRFLNMLRVARPTSPMSMGSWLLAAYGPAVGTAVVCDALDLLPVARAMGEAGAAVLGPAVATYTAVLVADTAIPVWHEGRHELPFLFAGGAAASAGAAALLHTPPAEAGAARRMAMAGVVTELVAAEVMQRRLGELGEPYHDGSAAPMARAATVSLTAGLIALLGARRSRSAAVLAGALVFAGSALERFAVFRAGFDSADDPRYVVEPQRRRLAARS